MDLKRYIVEIGTGLDQHGQDPTRAAQKAVKDAVSHACLAGLIEIVRLEDVNDMIVHIKVACPHPERVDREAVLEALPFGSKELEVVEGGMVTTTIFQPELGDTTDEMYVATAAVTVFVDMERVLEAWRRS